MNEIKILEEFVSHLQSIMAQHKGGIVTIRVCDFCGKQRFPIRCIKLIKEVLNVLGYENYRCRYFVPRGDIERIVATIRQTCTLISLNL